MLPMHMCFEGGGATIPQQEEDGAAVHAPVRPSAAAEAAGQDAALRLVRVRRTAAPREGRAGRAQGSAGSKVWVEARWRAAAGREADHGIACGADARAPLAPRAPAPPLPPSWAARSPSQSWKKVSITISSDEVGVFEVQGKFMGVNLYTTELRLEELLQRQFDKIQTMTLFGTAVVNVNLLLYLINKKFYV